MTGVDADLAILRLRAPLATARVEAELARLREELDEYKLAAGAEAQLFDESREHTKLMRERAEAAEARADALRRELDDVRDEYMADAGLRTAAEARCARLQQALQEMESAALKAAQLLPMTLSTSVEADHRSDHPSWAGWLLRHKVLPVARESLAGPDTPADRQENKT